MQYTDFQKQSVGGGLKMLGKSLKTVFDEMDFIVNLHSFPLASQYSRKTLPFPR